MERDTGRVLVVDDDAANRETLFDLLSSRGFAVLLAKDGEEALQLAFSQSPDVVLLDISMPGIDGFEVLLRIRERVGRSELPIIMVSGRGERDQVVRALESGACDYVTKPFDPMIVVARLRNQLSLKNAFDQISSLKRNLSEKNDELARTNAQMRGDLRSAAAVQRSLLPAQLPRFENVRFAWEFNPCEDLAGDILNVFQLDDRHVAFYLLDVSGHGVRAALLSVTLSRILTPLPDRPSLVRRRSADGEGFEPTPPAEIAEELNRRFQLDLETWQYFTLFYGLLDTQTCELHYISAGQQGPVYLPKGHEPRDLSEPIFAIGWVHEPRYEERRLQLHAGDRLYVVSDGVCEAKNSGKEFFGQPRLVKALGDHRRLPLRESMAGVLEQVRAFSGRSFEDDVSTIALEVGPFAETKRVRSESRTASMCPA